MADSSHPASSAPAAADERPVYVISIAAELAGMHPQTLRAYDRQGLVTPGRATGRGRRYSERDVALLREVQRLSQDEGVNLAGVKRILELEAQVTALRARLAELQADLDAAQVDALRREAEVHRSYRRDLVPVNRALVIWKPERSAHRGR
jgi:MerR family transcriptional regulator/heat shock protein HspR